MKLVNPANKRKYKVIVVGTGLAGGAAAATLAELGYDVECFCFQDSPRRAHSIAAQGGINAAKNYQNDGDSDLPPLLRHRQGRRLPRPRGERLPPRADHGRTSSTSASRRACRSPASTAACSPTARFGGAQVSRTFYARGQTGQQLLLGAYQALARQIGAGKVKMFPRTEMLDLVVEDGRARGIVARDLVTGEIESHAAHAVVLAHRRLRQRLLPLDERQGLQRHRDLARVQAGRRLREPLLHADPPDVHPGQRRLPVEAHADVRVAPQRRPRLGAEEARTTSQAPRPDPRGRARLLPRAQATRASATSSPRDIASRAAKERLRRRPRRRPGRARRLPRLRATPSSASARTDPREVRQPLRDVRAHHRREPVQGADAHLPRRPLHDGRALGRLQPDDHVPGPLRARRGELLRPRREPPRRVAR